MDGWLEPELVEAERLGIEILENAADRIEEAFWHPDFPLLLKVPALGPGGWLYITRHRVLSPAAQRAANRVCKEHGWKAPFPGVSEAEQAKPGATATARERPAQKFSMKAFLKSYGKAKIQTMMFEKKHNQSVVARKMLEDAEARTREQGVSLPKTAFDYFRNHVGKTARKMGRYDFSTPPK